MIGVTDRHYDIRMSPVGGAKDDVWLLVEVVWDPPVCAGREELDVAKLGQQFDRMGREGAEHRNVVIDLVGQGVWRKAVWPADPSHFEPGMLGLHFGDPRFVDREGDDNQQNAVGEADGRWGGKGAHDGHL